MKHPISSATAYSIFGSLIGSVPVLAIGFSKLLLFSPHRSFNFVFGTVLLACAVATGTAGWFSGKSARAIATTQFPYGVHMRVAFLFIVGLVWGMVCGAAGGVFLFVFGAIPMAFIGGAVGMLAFPIFHLLHEELASGERIELGHVLPIAVGMPLILVALYLGRYFQ